MLMLLSPRFFKSFGSGRNSLNPALRPDLRPNSDDSLCHRYVKRRRRRRKERGGQKNAKVMRMCLEDKGIKSSSQTQIV